LGKKIATNLTKYSGNVIALVGDLGSGKTTFTKGFARGLGIKDRMISPTFILIRSYQTKATSPKQIKTLHHLDLYRLESGIKQELKNMGLTEMWNDAGNIVLIEWAEKAKGLLPKNTLWITFEYVKGNERIIRLQS